MVNDRRDGGDRPRGIYRRDRDDHREARGGRGRDRGNSPNDHRIRSRSPRDRGYKRDRSRSSSRSPIRREDREERGRGGRDTDRRYRRDDRDMRSHERELPRGARGPPPGPRGDFDRHLDSRRLVRYEDDDDDDDMLTPSQPVHDSDLEGKPDDMDNETWAIYKVMGFARFKSTKNTKVPGNSSNYGVRKDKRMVARQYMNRQGGFNRPLSPSRGS